MKKKNLTYKDLEPYVLAFIPWASLEEQMGKRMYKKFNKFMRGQTCMEHGAYPCDVENFFREPNKRFID